MKTQWPFPHQETNIFELKDNPVKKILVPLVRQRRRVPTSP